MNISDLDKFLCENKDRRVAVTKMKNLNNPEWGTSDVAIGRSYVGQVTLKFVDDEEFSGGRIYVDGGYTLRTSVVREVVQKSPTRWLAKTLNSVYRVEVLG